MSRSIVRLQRYAPHQKYTLQDGSQVAGASTIAKLGESNEGLIIWANREGLAGRNCRATAQTAADTGTIAHFIVDCHLKGVEPDLREFEEWEIRSADDSVLKALDFLDREKLHPVDIERQMVSEIHRYGGTLDLVASDGEGLVLIDWKSSKALYNSHKWQLGGYENLWNENNDEPIKRRAIIRIPKGEKGKFAAHWISDEDAQKHMHIFTKQAALYNVIKDSK